MCENAVDRHVRNGNGNRVAIAFESNVGGLTRTIKYDELSSILCFNYRTYMNFLAISPHIIQSILQNQNIKLETVNKYKDEKKDK